jgi:esterase/lipase
MKKIFIKLLKWTGILLVGLVVTYFLGPRAAKPTLQLPVYQQAASLQALEDDLKRTEAAEPGIKPGCEATIVWADTAKKEKTKVAMVYIHGFGASHEEGAPVHTNIAKTFGCNLLLARMDEHGVQEGENNFAELTADSYIESAERALHTARQLGDSVVILATSAGGALSLYLASKHPDIKAVVNWSPCIRFASGTSGIMAGPWGIQIARQIRGGNHNDWPYKKDTMRYFWTNHQRFEGLVQFSVFIETFMQPETYAKVKCPYFMGYYYENEENQDKVVSVAAMREMFGQLGTPAPLKREVNFPNTRDHVIASQIVSQDWQGVERESIAFLREIVRL